MSLNVQLFQVGKIPAVLTVCQFALTIRTEEIFLRLRSKLEAQHCLVILQNKAPILG